MEVQEWQKEIFYEKAIVKEIFVIIDKDVHFFIIKGYVHQEDSHS